MRRGPSIALLPGAPLAACALLACALVLAACGGGSDDKDASGTPGATSGTSGESLGTPGPDSPTVTAAEVSAAVGDETDVPVQVTGFGPPGMGAWTFDISYDPDIISIVNCAAEPGSDAQGVCNPDYGDSIVRITGAVALGLEGDTTVGIITVKCEAAGTSPLTIVVDVLADATIGDPQELATHVTGGSVTCGDAAAGETPDA